MNVRWTSEAVQNRRDILELKSKEYPIAALSLDKRFGDVADDLSDNPFKGEKFNERGNFKFLINPYWMIYEIYDNTVWILNLIHTSRNWP